MRSSGYLLLPPRASVPSGSSGTPLGRICLPGISEGLVPKAQPQHMGRMPERGHLLPPPGPLRDDTFGVQDISRGPLTRDSYTLKSFSSAVWQTALGAPAYLPSTSS